MSIQRIGDVVTIDRKDGRIILADHEVRIELEVSDPWGFCTVHGTGPFHGRLIKFFASEEYDADKPGVAKLDTPLDFQGMQYEYLLVQSRHADVRVAEIENGRKVFCNLSPISETSANAADPLVASRSGHRAAVLVGSIIRGEREES